MKLHNVRFILALIAVISCLAAIAGLFFIEMPQGNRDLVNIALGAMLGWGGSVLSFYFGDNNPQERKE